MLPPSPLLLPVFSILSTISFSFPSWILFLDILSPYFFHLLDHFFFPPLPILITPLPPIFCSLPTSVLSSLPLLSFLFLLLRPSYQTFSFSFVNFICFFFIFYSFYISYFFPSNFLSFLPHLLISPSSLSFSSFPFPLSFSSSLQPFPFSSSLIILPLFLLIHLLSSLWMLWLYIF